MNKIGRNDPCPCGSGKKYKKCHGGIDSQPQQGYAVTLNSQNQGPPGLTIRKLALGEITPEVLRKITPQARQDRAYTSQFGHVRQPITAEFQGFRFVAAGNQLLYQPSDRAQFFTDILMNFVPIMFGKAWFDGEVAKPIGSRHPVMESRVKALTYIGKQPKNPDGSYHFQTTGPVISYLTFAYDLFVVKDNGRLDARLLERLKNCNTFQGARHELFAEATCLRAGYTIEHEDETDGSTRHAEFTATHRITGLKISVEAKSKHRPGVLGQPGTVEADGQHNLKIGHLLNDAIHKNAQHPLAVFLDLNLPWNTAERLLGMEPPRPPHPVIQNTLDRMRRRHGGTDPINLLVITNHPAHYSAEEEAAPSPHFLCIQSQVPSLVAARPDALLAIHQAVIQSGRIPQFFPGKEPPPQIQRIRTLPVPNIGTDSRY